MAVLLLSVGCNRSIPEDLAATVNNRPITNEELDAFYVRQFGANAAEESPESTLIKKLEVLRSMIDSEIMLQRAEKQSLIAVDADVDARFNELKAPFTEEEFRKFLDERKLNIDQLRAQIRRDLSIQRLFNKEITSHITITDQEVKDFYEANQASFNLAEPRIQLAQIVVTGAPDPNVRNLKNDKAQTPEEARKKIEMIRNRLENGEDFATLAQNYSEDPNTAANGGDVGLIPESALQQASPELRRLILELKPGQISPILPVQDGYRIIRLISKEPAGQRDLNDPRVQQTIRNTMLNRKDQLLKAAYYEVARNEAEVENYFARKIASTKGKLEKP